VKPEERSVVKPEERANTAEVFLVLVATVVAVLCIIAVWLDRLASPAGHVGYTAGIIVLWALAVCGILAMEDE
jgi:fatty-acid desaturase